jgi:hypothetical protein
MEKGFPETIQLTLDDWTHIQYVDYEHLPFKCKACHEYGNFPNSLPKAQATQQPQGDHEQWKTHKKKEGIW